MNIIYYLNSNCLYKFYYYYILIFDKLNVRITCQYTSTNEEIEATDGIGRKEFDNEFEYFFPK